MDKILTLDLATSMGWYVSGETKANTVVLDKNARFVDFYAMLTAIIEENKEITKIVHEDAGMQRSWAAQYYGGYLGILQLFCWEYNLELDKVHSKTVNSKFIGEYKMPKGSKSKAIKAATMDKCTKLGIEHDSHDAADAYAVYFTYCQLTGRNIK